MSGWTDCALALLVLLLCTGGGRPIRDESHIDKRKTQDRLLRKGQTYMEFYVNRMELPAYALKYWRTQIQYTYGLDGIAYTWSQGRDRGLHKCKNIDSVNMMICGTTDFPHGAVEGTGHRRFIGDAMDASTLLELDDRAVLSHQYCIYMYALGVYQIAVKAVNWKWLSRNHHRYVCTEEAENVPKSVRVDIPCTIKEACGSHETIGIYFSVKWFKAEEDTIFNSPPPRV